MDTEWVLKPTSTEMVLARVHILQYSSAYKEEFDTLYTEVAIQPEVCTIVSTPYLMAGTKDRVGMIVPT